MGRHLTTEDMEVVATRYAEGESCPALARAFGVSQETMRTRIKALGVVMRKRGRYPSDGPEMVTYAGKVSDDLAFTGTWEQRGLIRRPVR